MSDPETYLDEAVRKHYGDQALDSEALERVKALVSEPGTVGESVFLEAKVSALGGATRGQRRRMQFLAAAAAVILVSVGVYFFDSDTLRPAWRQQASTAAEAVAADHLTGKLVQFPATTFAAIGPSMDELGFTPVEPTRLKGRGFVLKGARYCAVTDLKAAQITLTDKAGKPVTLYEFRPDERYADLRDCSFQIGELQVSLWREGNLCFVLAR